MQCRSKGRVQVVSISVLRQIERRSVEMVHDDGSGVEVRLLHLRNSDTDVVHRVVGSHTRNCGVDVGRGVGDQAIDAAGSTGAVEDLALFLQQEAIDAPLIDVGLHAVHIVQRFFRYAEVVGHFHHGRCDRGELQFRLRLQRAFRYGRGVVGVSRLAEVFEHGCRGGGDTLL